MFSSFGNLVRTRLHLCFRGDEMCNLPIEGRKRVVSDFQSDLKRLAFKCQVCSDLQQRNDKEIIQARTEEVIMWANMPPLSFTSLESCPVGVDSDPAAAMTKPANAMLQKV